MRIQNSNPAKSVFCEVYKFGNDSSKRTLYIIGPYKGRVAYFQFFIKRFVKKGYRILFLQPHHRILDIEHPEWLGMSITEATQIIQSDSASRSDKTKYLLGISLGSYLGLNVQLAISFSRFVVVAGGAPLNGVFRSSGLFRRARRKAIKLALTHAVSGAWEPYDKAYADCDLSRSKTLFINSNKDAVIKRELMEEFLESYEKTGVAIVNNQKGYLPHALQALSLNFRVKQVADFLEG